jgi:hypothetical protein
MKRVIPLCLSVAALLLLPLCSFAQRQPRGELFLGFAGRTGGDPVLKGWDFSGAVHLNEQLEIAVDFSGQYAFKDVTQPVVTLASFLKATPDQYFDPNAFSVPTSPSPTLQTIYTGTDIHSLMIGPQFSHQANKRIRVFGRTLFGGTRIHASAAGAGGFDFIYIGGGLRPSGQSSEAAHACHAGDQDLVPVIKPYLNFYPLPNTISGLGGSISTFSNISVTSSAFRVCDTRTGFSFGAGGGLDVDLSRHWAVRVIQADYVNQPRVLNRGTNAFRMSSGIVWQW